jgi:hypothetical protein
VFIEELTKDYMLKGVGEPEYYLGGNIDPWDSTWRDDNLSLWLASPACTYLQKVLVEHLKPLLGLS